MPPVVNPVSDLARIYRQRVPTQTAQAKFGPEAIARIQPNMNRGAGPLGALARAGWGILASPAATLADIVVPGYEPERAGSFNILQQGGADLERSTRRAVGDITAIPGIGRPSASPTVAGIREAGLLAGIGNAALDYGNLATTAAPFVGIPAHRAAERLAQMKLDEELGRVVVGAPMSLEDYIYGAAGDKQLGFNYSAMPREFEHAKLYYGQHFPDIQEHLRGGSVPWNLREELAAKTAIRALDTLIEKAPQLSRPLRVYRGIKNRGYRSNYGEFIESLKAGDRFTEPGFVSTSIDPEMAEGFSRNGYVMQIEVPSSQRVISGQHFYDDPFKMVSPEREITLPRNSTFEVTKREGNKLFVRLVPGQR